MTTVQPKPSTSTPMLPSFLKPKPSTSTPISSKKPKNKTTPNGNQRKRSTSIFSTTSKESVNTQNGFNRKLASVLSLKSYKKQSKLDDIFPETIIQNQTSEHQVILEEEKGHTFYSQPSHSSLGSLSESESSTNTTEGDTNDTFFVNSLSTTPEEEDVMERNYETIEITIESDSGGEEEEEEKITTQEIIFSCPSPKEDTQICNEMMHPKASNKKKRQEKKEDDKKEGKKRPVSLLKRTRSRKWSNSSITHEFPVPELPVCKIDPTTFLAGPGAFMPPGTHCIYKNQKFSLMNRLLESMMYGGYVTSRLHIPMDLWYQPSVRLPYIEAKIAASELLIAVLEKMNTRKHIEWNMNAVKNELRTLYQTLNQINDTLMKKLGCHVLILPTKKDLVNTQRQSNRTSQAIVSWSSKFSKMRFDSRNTSPNDEQNQLYIKILIKLFTDAKVLESWDTKLESLLENSGDRKPLVEEAYQINTACISLFVSIVCGFVMKDYDILLEKWFKRSTYWMTE
ncbi:hypothetical protein G6F56_008203 [Rhizopus delemar]|nr:hypothetical protein G6F56_008203 [Rhizopus delemar]